MNDEYIKKDDAITEVAEFLMGEALLDSADASDNIEDWKEIAVAILENIPTADVVERKHGEWIPATWKDAQAPVRLRKHKCSVCGEKAKSIVVDIKLVDNYYCHKSEPITEYEFDEFLSDLCPNCGAKMRGADDE